MRYIISANVEKSDGYNIIEAFKKYSEIDWHKVSITNGIQIGDVVYIYISAPIHQIKYKCICVNNNVNVSNRIDDKEFYNDKDKYHEYKEFYRLRLVESYSDDNEYYKLGTFKALNLVNPEFSFRWTINDKTYLNLFEHLEYYDEYVLNDLNTFDARDFVLVDFKPKEKQTPSIVNGRKRWDRNYTVARRSLRMEGFKCMIDEEHTSFFRRNSTEKYMEAHHLVPLEFSDEFAVSLDVEANIVSLCSNCHNQIHYGEGADELITKLYDLRREYLLESGINISLERLLNMYDFYD